MSGRVDTTAQARPTNSATTKFTTIHGCRICCSEPGGLDGGGSREKKTTRQKGGAQTEVQSSPESLVGRGVEVDAVAGHLLTEGQDQGYKIH